MKKLLGIIAALLIATNASAYLGYNDDTFGSGGGGGSGDITTVGTCTTGNCFIDGGSDYDLIFEGSTDDGYETTITATDPTADRTVTFGDKSGTVALTTGALTDGNCAEFDANGVLQDSGAACSNPAGGDVSGPGSSTDNAITRFDGTGGKTVQNSGVTIDDSANVSTSGTVTASYFISSSSGLSTIEEGITINNSGCATASCDTTLAGDTLNVAVVDASLDSMIGLGAWNLSGADVEIPNGTSLTSGDCDAAGEAGRIFVDTDATSGQQLYVCEGASGWVLQGDGGAAATTYVQLAVFEWTTDVATGDGAYYFSVPASLNSKDITSVHAEVITAGTTGTTDIQIHNVTDSVDVLSTKLTVDSGETGSDTAATAAVINTSNDDLATYDVLRVDVDAVSTTAPAGLIVTLGIGS